MSIDRFRIGLEFDVSYPNFQASLKLLSVTQLQLKSRMDPRSWGDVPQVVTDDLRIAVGKLAEHSGVWKDEDPVSATLGGISMFDPEQGVVR